MTLAEMMKSVERNAALLGRATGKALLATAVTAGEFAMEAKILDKIGKDIDEDNPPSFGQNFAAFVTGFVGTGAQIATAYCGLVWAAEEFDNWDSGEKTEDDESEE